MSEITRGGGVRLQLRHASAEISAVPTEGGAVITLVQSIGGRESLRVEVPLDAEWVNYFGQELQAMCPAPPPSSSAE